MSILDWNGQAGDDNLADGFSTTVDGVDVAFNVAQSANNDSFTAGKSTFPIHTDGDDPFAGDGGLLIGAVSTGDISDNTLTFGQNVENLNFRISDIDTSSIWQDQLVVYGLDEDGNRVPITVSGGSSVNVTNSGNTVTATGQAPGGSVQENSPSASLEFSITGPIRQLVIEYKDSNGSPGGYQYVVVSDIYFEAAPICFAAGTMIETDTGEIAIEDLRQGDMVRTYDNGVKPVAWVGRRHLPFAQIEAAPHMRPIRIRAGALGDGIPSRDLIVSPQHRVMVRSHVAQRMFDSNEVLVAAKHLVAVDGIDAICPAEGVEYVHFLLDQHEIVTANGAQSETLYTGSQALNALSQAARDEILTLFPELADMSYVAPPARPLVSGRKGRSLAQRHQQNAKPLMDLLPM